VQHLPGTFGDFHAIHLCHLHINKRYWIRHWPRENQQEANAAPNDPSILHTLHASLHDRQTDTAIIIEHSLHLMQPKKAPVEQSEMILMSPLQLNNNNNKTTAYIAP